MRRTHAGPSGCAEAAEHACEALALFTLAGSEAPAVGPATNSRPPESGPRELATEIQPRERLLRVGPEALSNAELLSIFLGKTPEKDALALATNVISESGGLYGLSRADFHELLQVRGVDKTEATVLLAAVELGKRLASAGSPERPIIGSPVDVHVLLGPRLAHQDREHFVVCLLDTKNRVLASPTVSIGTLSSSPVHPREVFKPAIKASAASVILVHNHPSGHVEPSREDREVTERLARAGETLGIEVLDHVIVGDGYLSLKERGML